ncbi:MAG TPA: cation diffusion facilitator family transporter, partial [Xanthobacteraceae bacterium]|nr:cation diffusion facilitator family transporter [Xanthobacteraceae bacterium]
HQYGHGKFENIAALAETAILFLLAGIIIWEGAKRLIGAEVHAVETNVWAFGVIIVSIVVDFFRARALTKVAKQTSSQALEADALHFSSDMWSSLAALVGLIFIALGYAMADSIAAIAIAILICVAGWRLARSNVDTLTDLAPAGVGEEMKAIARGVPDVISIPRLRVRQVGAQTFADVEAAVSRTLPLDRVSEIKTAIKTAILQKFPDAEVSVITEARALDDESIMEQIMVIARNQARAIHHVTVHQLENKLSVSLDLEVDGILSLGEAHEIASELENAIRAELGGNVEVETHIEPMQTDGIKGADAPALVREEISKVLQGLVKENSVVKNIHSVRVRETPRGLVVNFHCYAEPILSVEAVHRAVDTLERDFLAARADVHRAIGHAEPPTAKPH